MQGVGRVPEWTLLSTHAQGTDSASYWYWGFFLQFQLMKEPWKEADKGGAVSLFPDWD